MRSSNVNRDGLLARVNFPLYSVEMITSRHCVVAGGGGMAKTGVANGFEIFEIRHDGLRFIAEEIVRYETGENAVMNCAVAFDGHCTYLVTGQENQSQLYKIKTTVADAVPDEEVNATASSSSSGSKVRSRKKSKSEHVKDARRVSLGGEVFDTDNQRLKFDVIKGQCVQTDFTAVDPLQRVVRIAPSGKLMITGGTDGHVRVWSFPKMNLVFDLALHTREADDLDISPDSKRFVSVAKDGLAIVSSAETGLELFKLQWKMPDRIKYMFKRCRYAVQEGKLGKARLFTISNPCGRGGKQKGVLQQWDAHSGRLNALVEAPESLSALAVRDDGRFVATGSMFTGSVTIYVAFSLHAVHYIPNAHSMFVTGLEFLPLNRYGPDISSDAEAAVLSISVDNKVCIHSMKPRHSIPVWLAILLIILVLFIAFFVCSVIGI